MSIIHEADACDGALVELTIGDTTIYSYNRQVWYTDPLEVLTEARRHWEMWLEIHQELTGPDRMMAKIDKRLGELLPQA